MNYTDPALQLESGEIHLWYTRGEAIQDSALLARYRELLDPTELRKQQRFRFAKDRHSALITRAFLRDLLSAYAPIAPADWRFTIGDRGKPEIAASPLPLRFNLSHTHGLIICAVTLALDIGCDVEFVPRRTDPLTIARHHFSKQELAELFSLPEAEQRSRFFDYWTLKESYIKACGAGIFGVPLQDFNFSIAARTTSRVNSSIQIGFAPGILDNPQNWHSVLYYPCETHRIAISTKTLSSPGQGIPRYFRMFESKPLIGRREIPWGDPITGLCT